MVAITRKYVLVLVLMIVLLPGSLFARGGAEEPAPEKGPVVVASKIDTEGALLGSMIVQLLRADGFEVVDRTQFGPTDVIRRAIINDEIDIYPEYTGNGGFFFEGTDSGVWRDAETAYETVRDLDLEEHNIVWLRPAPANNTWAIAIREDLAEQERITDLEELAAYLERGGSFRLAGSEEFVSRDDALPAFEDEYGFSLDSDQLLVLSGGDTAVTAQAAARGTDGVNAAMAYGTDGQLAALGLVVLEDTRGVQPVYEPAPILRADIHESYPEIEEILSPVFATLTLTTLQELNSKIAVEGQDAEQVAGDYLREQGFLQ